MTGQAGERGEVEARVALAVLIGGASSTGHVYGPDGNDACQKAADLVLASDWLAAHVRAAQERAWDEGYESAPPITANPYASRPEPERGEGT